MKGKVKPKLNHSDLPTFLLDKMCQRLFQYNGSLSKAEREERKHVVQFIRSEETFQHLEELANCTDSSWLYHLDSLCPYLTPANRKLAILTYLKLSSEAIALLTERASINAVHTAKTRLKKTISEIGSVHGEIILKSL